MSELLKDTAFVRCWIIVSLYCVGLWSVSYSLFPLFGVIAPATRYTATAVGGAGLIILVLAAFRAPRLLDFHVLQGIAIFGLVGGGICAFIGVQEHQPALVVIGACSMGLARNITEVFVVLAVSRLKKKRIIPCITLGFLMSLVLQLSFVLLPLWIDQVSYVVFPLIGLLLMSKSLVPLFEKLQRSVAPAEVNITQPKAFLSFSHQLFIFIFLSRFSYGYALGLGEDAGGVPQLLNVVSLVPPLVLLAFVALAKPARFNMDRIFVVTVFFMVAGFVFVPYSTIAFEGFVNTLLSVGSNCLLLLLWCVFSLIAHKSKQEGLIAFSWGRALLALGVTLGAFLSRQYNSLVSIDATMAAFLSAAVTLLFIGYVLFTLKDFSLEKIVQDIAPTRVSRNEGIVQNSIKGSCESLGEKFGLTPREVEVLALVAKGRSAPFIEEELVISRNTVKSHVKHIYNKLGVHTNQELINLVERSAGQS